MLLLSKRLKYTLLIFIALLSSCATFYGNNIQPLAIDKSSIVSNAEKVWIEVQFFDGEINSNTQLNHVQTDKLARLVQYFLARNKYFTNYTVITESKKITGKLIKLHMYSYGNIALATLSGFITGYSLGVIPGYTKSHYLLDVELVGEGSAKYQFHDSVSMWLGLLFIPVMPFVESLEQVVSKTFLKMLSHAFAAISNATSNAQ
jgi:hypothetical protein